ncbi:Gfo/Idh/MocA family protein [Paenibacillus macquariensis]|uniref:Predicted dehydrogenase n=1 Tax=Paenibacillus macquariensis TaxID=948756 RepID=A0ABY1JUX8_9BACL|nr:Gfo/Idh/MocA family oxidoreductase [Paenibacillus macquariensis]MEC0090868.1 Gfo/Idh/MocA family oxidoreductase [Paenibacillus macquariensis]OAB34600.1 glycosyl hydrolase [Paenibacillus macquariensis subsp. macquariensis]SIQ81771.1 Predicted dehydrogenase [Paenibacillus macquariensis]
MSQISSTKVRLGVIGLGGRGISLLSNLLDMPDVEISAVCEVFDDRLQVGIEQVVKSGRPKPESFHDYRELLALPNIDGVVIFTSWTSHAQIAIAAMKAGKYTATEVGGASSLEECWDLVRTSEETGMPCMLLENCCYVRNEMAILHMVKKGMFGELIHCQGGYEHDLRDEVAMGLENRHYRYQQYLNRNGEIYPTHELGPIAKYLDINRGNRFMTLTSMASKARGIHEWVVDQFGKDDAKAKLAFAQGDIVTTMIKCAHGETILLTHDTTLPRPYSRGGRVQGTRGLWMEDNNSIHIEGRSPLHTWESFDPYLKEFEHPLWEQYIKMGVRGGHDGMDYLCLRAFIDSVKEGTPTPIDVYDTVAWMGVTALSEQSIALGSMPVHFPDFTNGQWINRAPSMPSKYSLDTIPTNDQFDL